MIFHYGSGFNMIIGPKDPALEAIFSFNAGISHHLSQLAMTDLVHFIGTIFFRA